MWPSQVRTCKEDQRMNKPGNSMFRIPECHTCHCSLYREPGRRRFHISRARIHCMKTRQTKRNLNGSWAHLSALHLWFEIEFSITQMGKSTSYLVWKIKTEIQKRLYENIFRTGKRNTIRKKKAYLRKWSREGSRGKFQATVWHPWLVERDGLYEMRQNILRRR